MAGEINICSMSRSFLLTRALPSETDNRKLRGNGFQRADIFHETLAIFHILLDIYQIDLAKTQAHIRIPHERASFIPSKVINPTGANEGRND